MPDFLSHNAALEVTDTPEHLSLHLPYVIGYSVDSSHQDIGKSAGIFIVLSNIWMLLNIGRALNSGWPLQIQGDATFTVCAEAVGVLGIGVNSLGASNHWLALAIIPEDRESAEMYKQTWISISNAFHMLMTRYRKCYRAKCSVCEAVFSIKEQPHVQELLQDDDFNIRRILPVRLAGSDNSEAWRKFCREALNLPADQCSRISQVKSAWPFHFMRS